MKKRLAAVLCMMAILGSFFRVTVDIKAEEAPTYETQVKDSAGTVYGSYILTNLYAGCTYGCTVRTPKADIAKMMNITSEEEFKGGEPVLYVGNFSWDTTEKRLADDLMKQFGGELAFLLDMQLFKYDGMSNIPYTTVPSPIQLKIGIPEKANRVPMWEDNREFAMIRIHDGKAELLRDLDTDIRTITFDTDKFSVYALVYAPAGNIDTYLGNVQSAPETPAASPAASGNKAPSNSEYDDVPKTGDIAWELEYSY